MPTVHASNGATGLTSRGYWIRRPYPCLLVGTAQRQGQFIKCNPPGLTFTIVPSENETVMNAYSASGPCILVRHQLPYVALVRVRTLG